MTEQTRTDAGEAGTGATGPSGATCAARPGRRATVAAAVAGLCLGLLALGPGLLPGYLLSYDMVFVPRPPFNGSVLGTSGTLPRAVPSDAVIATLARALPADAMQKIVLLAIFVLACSGAARLLARERLPAQLVAGVCYAWNPFVAERLIIGQWATLLGYAGLPWVVAVLAAPARGLAGRVRLVVALVPAAIGGFAAMLISGLTAVPVAVLPAAEAPVGLRGRLQPGRPRARGARHAQPALADPGAHPPRRDQYRRRRPVRGQSGHPVRHAGQSADARRALERAGDSGRLRRPRQRALVRPRRGRAGRLRAARPAAMARPARRGGRGAGDRAARCARSWPGAAARSDRLVAGLRRAPRRPAVHRPAGPGRGARARPGDGPAAGGRAHPPAAGDPRRGRGGADRRAGADPARAGLGRGGPGCARSAIRPTGRRPGG